ncbi:MAG: hypothetical protein QXT26_07070 [Thermoproteota archaeon]
MSMFRCPHCGKQIDIINVREEYQLYFDDGNQTWHWSPPEGHAVSFYCPECGRELPDSDELEFIVISAVE